MSRWRDDARHFQMNVDGYRRVAHRTQTYSQDDNIIFDQVKHESRK